MYQPNCPGLPPHHQVVRRPDAGHHRRGAGAAPGGEHVALSVGHRRADRARGAGGAQPAAPRDRRAEDDAQSGPRVRQLVRLPGADAGLCGAHQSAHRADDLAADGRHQSAAARDARRLRAGPDQDGRGECVGPLGGTGIAVLTGCVCGCGGTGGPAALRDQHRRPEEDDIPAGENDGQPVVDGLVPADDGQSGRE